MGYPGTGSKWSSGHPQLGYLRIGWREKETKTIDLTNTVSTVTHVFLDKDIHLFELFVKLVTLF